MKIVKILDKLYAHQVLSRAESQAIFDAMIQGQMDPIILSSVLTAFKIRGEHPDEIAGAAQALLAAATPFPNVDG